MGSAVSALVDLLNRDRKGVARDAQENINVTSSKYLSSSRRTWVGRMPTPANF
jgi:hypothetical protein